ncbi:uncharacterized protein LOC119722923 [Patiria miniata]|uniref:Uncharacterized protein n=1 Tax=Patiria miniata TaxID=46514 RepID=A0A913ZBU8_PATMI|nr:uncharacterized protein LOC119722923 [Patiria miniata]
MNVVRVADPAAMAATAGTCTEQDIRQIERFFTSLKSRVYVCPALANLYFTTLQDMANLGGWELATTGFPTLIFENRQNERRIVLCIAEKGTGFVQWKDGLNQDSQYKSPERNFHTLCVSGDAHKLAGLSFDNDLAAAELLDTVHAWLDELASEGDPANSKKKKRKHKEPKVTLPKKETISQPCMFEHVTNLDHEKFVQRMMGNATAVANPQQTGGVPQQENGDTSKMLAYAESTSTEDSGMDELHE